MITKHLPTTENRIRLLITQRLEQAIYSQQQPLRVEAYHHESEPIPFESASKKDFQAFRVGEKWGKRWATTWFRFSGQVPVAWAGRTVHALICLKDDWKHEGFGTEGLVYMDGKPVRALNANRRDVPLFHKARGGETFEFYVEAACNFASSDGLGEDGYPDYRGVQELVLGQADLACYNHEAHDLYVDAFVAWNLMGSLPEDSVRRAKLRFALNQMADLYEEGDPEAAGRCRRVLAPVLRSVNGSSAPLVSAVGHAHIDTAWLWPLRETIRKCARTFSTALRNMEKYPEFTFVCSQPQQYEWMKRHYPSIYEDIRAAIRRGQWEPVGSMWIESDCNVPSGESLVRQILIGKKFFREEFGYETRDVWIPDVFGYSAALPQIMRKSGVDYFLTQKISWSAYNRFPHHTFYWEGLDGTRIFTHFPPADTYNGSMEPGELRRGQQRFLDQDRANRWLYIYGFGDGGGGPSEKQIMMSRRLKDLEDAPKVQHQRVRDFFPEAEADAKATPLWVGELYLELHRGTLTTQAANKRGNRKSELLLRDAEFLASLDVEAVDAWLEQTIGSREVPLQEVWDCTDFGLDRPRMMERAWKLLLLNQFHDIIPGSSITWVYRDSDKDYDTIRQLAQQVQEAGLHNLARRIDASFTTEPVLFLNTLCHPRCEVVALPHGQLGRVDVPPCGYAVLSGSASVRPLPEGVQPVSVHREGNRFVLQNGLLNVRLGADGLLESIYDVEAEREVLAAGQKANVLQIFDDRPSNWDAWDFEIHAYPTKKEITAVESIEIVSESPLRGEIKVRRKFSGSTFEQIVRLDAGSRRLEFHTRMNWNESNKLLKVAFPVEVHTNLATYEVQFGHAQRPNHYNTSWDEARFEVCGHKWAALTETGYGVALLNDCKYGHDILGKTIRLTLLRAPKHPDPRADIGEHKFSYALLPFSGDLQSGKVIEEAYAFNVPIIVRDLNALKNTAHSSASGNQPAAADLPERNSFFEVSREGVIIDTVKPAEDGKGIIVRLYEALGARGKVNLQTILPFKKATLCDLLENELKHQEIAMPLQHGTLTLDVKPFEIVTLRLK